ncbi:UDP-N-acetylmuramoyl-L-alanyl-D-glutamate--2,6-diaminopimelate ligase [Candidatus Saccharibacteria bacterium]|nr:UDP-N-acetylmuramoyl-L-alanyl-D-glutamate--2,6-diaminopimelate ligase [Candidatus Saccharibacteria bacterium]
MKKLLEKLPFYNHAVLPYHFAQSIIATAKYRHPTKHLRVIGVTGTNGKTTTCFMIWHMLRAAGYKTGLMTTVAHGVDKLEPELGHMTTVDAITLNRRIRSIADSGAEFLVLEVTSHALAEYRTWGISFEIAVFTNLTHDHLDYHKTIDNYRRAKGKLFKKAAFSILNADDNSSEYYRTLAHDYTTYGIKSGDNRAKSIKLNVSGVRYSYHDIISDTDFKISTQIPGEFNVYNSLAAAIVGSKLGLTRQQIEDGIASLSSVEGRMNLVDEGQPFTVIVDYAHAPDALEKVYDSVKGHKGQIISVHGGAGRRDPSTRPIRGRILAHYSDIVIITEDDSRDEDPELIAAGFIEGAEKEGKTLGKDLFKELNREKAIRLALSKAKPGDLVLLLGKGHEKTILRADGAHDFEDIKVAARLLRDLGYHKSA